MGLPLREAREVFERDYLIVQISRLQRQHFPAPPNSSAWNARALHRKLKALGVSWSKDTAKHVPDRFCAMATTCRGRQAGVSHRGCGYQFADGVYEVCARSSMAVWSVWTRHPGAASIAR